MQLVQRVQRQLGARQLVARARCVAGVGVGVVARERGRVSVVGLVRLLVGLVELVAQGLVELLTC